jgi:ferredoxin-like protein FixX
MKAQCIVCYEPFNPRRLELGYRTCLECGGKAAVKEKARKAKCSAPAYNKGAYQYVGTVQAAKGVGR